MYVQVYYEMLIVSFNETLDGARVEFEIRLVQVFTTVLNRCTLIAHVIYIK